LLAEAKFSSTNGPFIQNEERARAESLGMQKGLIRYWLRSAVFQYQFSQRFGGDRRRLGNWNEDG
jgi:hypothetical protein